jgi:methyl-accepting chemotaxis protein
MSSALGDRGNVSSPLGETKKQVTDNLPERPSKPEHQVSDTLDKAAPRSIPDLGDSESQLEGHSNSNEGDEGEMVPAAGRINEKGEVIDDDGTAIGKVTTGEATDFVGFIVTQEGDILDHDGGVVGKAEPLEDVASELGNYTTKSTKGDEKEEAGGLGGALGSVGNVAKGATSTVGKTAKGLTDTVGATTGTEDVTDKVGETTKDTTDTVGETAKGATDTAGEAAEPVTDTLDDATGGATEKVGDTAGEATDKVGETADEAGDKVGETVDEAGEKVDETKEGLPDTDEKLDETKEGLPDADEKLDETKEDLPEGVEGVKDTADDAVEGAKDTAEGVPEEAGEAVEGVPEEAGEAVEGVKDDAGELAEQEPIPIEIPEFAPSVAAKVVAMFEGPFTVADDGQVTDQNGKILGRLAEGQDLQDLIGKEIKGIDENGNLLGDNDTVLGKVDLVPEGTIVDRIKEEVPEAADRLDALEEEAKQKLPPISVLEGLNINKAGNVVDEKGNVLGRVKSGDIKKLVGKQADAEGRIWDSKGNVIGEVEVVAEAIESLTAPFEDFPDAVVDKDGKVIFEGRQVGVVVGDEFEKLVGKKVDADGDILDKNGNVIGKAERKEAEEAEPEPEPEVEQIDYSVLKDKKVNKAGNVVDDKGQVWGHIVQGILKNLIGKKVGDNGEIFNDAGKVIGKAEPVPESEREDAKEPSPFEDFPNATVGDQGKVLFNGEQIGVVVEGDHKKLKGKTVDADGDITDKNGNVLGRAERWEADEPEPEAVVDNSALAGKRINKAGNAVDSHGDIYGRVIEGDLKRLIGKMCDKQGFIRNEGGDVIGKAELIPEAEREGLKEGPFTELPGCTVNKEGHVVTPGGDVVGRLTSGDPKILFGRAVDDDGDILDKNGNVLGHAERWEPEEVKKDVNAMSGRKVNREGNVVDENGDIIGKLTSGDLSKCAGKKIDDDGDVIDQKGSILGHVSLLEDIPAPEPEGETESPEDKEKREKLDQDRKIAQQICVCIEHSLDKIRPICKMITDNIDKAERTPEEDRDEEELVKVVRPLIEEGGKILTEANGVIRGLDPDGRISANAKHKTAAREATPEEYHLADLLKELTGTVTETIENAKRKLEDMTYAKKELNPLWGLLAEPLFQIIAAVGLLLSGVLGLVGKLLNGLGLGGLVNNLLGGLGITKVLDGLGLGSIVGSVTGQDKKKGGKKSGGGLLGGIL